MPSITGAKYDGSRNAVSTCISIATVAIIATNSPFRFLIQKHIKRRLRTQLPQVHKRR
jgi:hypothetical protein